MSIVLECGTEGVGRFTCAQAGCGSCVQSLLREHRGLVYRVLQRVATGQGEYADLVQEGWIGLWQAIVHYEVGRGVRFSSYACVVIEHRLWEAVSRTRKAQGWQERQGQEEALERVVRVWQEAQIREALGEELAVLPPRLCEVIALHYGFWGAEPQNLAEIGRGWGLSRERIRQLHEEALDLLRLPALSIRLRGLCEQGERRHYRQTLHDLHSRQRRGRRRA